MNYENKTIFMNKGNYSYYSFKEGRGISADYAKIDKANTPSNHFYMCFWNTSGWHGKDVNIQVGAFKFNDTYKTETREVISEIIRRQVPIFDE